MTASIQLLAEDIHKRFGSNEVLKGVSITAHKGDVISMIGSSGSGKSTFLRCLNLLEQPHAGRIVLDGEELALVPDARGALHAQSAEQLKQLRSQVAMVFQHFNLWAHMTALENVIEAPLHVLKLSRAEALERAQAYLQRVGVYHRKDAYPAHLSGGEQQRVAIARALVSDPTLLVCNEPTGDLDRKTADEILTLLQRLNREHGKTIVMVTHDPKAAEYAARTVHLDKGTLIADTPAAA